MVIDLQICSIMFQLFLFVSLNWHRGLSHRVSYIFLWFIPKGTHTSRTHCMSEIIREKKWVSGGEEQLQRRGEEGRLGIIKYSKTTTTTFGWEIIGCSIEVGVSWHCFSVAAINNHYMVLHGVRKRDPLKWSYYGHIHVSVNQSWCCTPTIYDIFFAQTKLAKTGLTNQVSNNQFWTPSLSNALNVLSETLISAY